MSAERVTFDITWCKTHLQPEKRMRMDLPEEQFTEWKNLKHSYKRSKFRWNDNIRKNKQNTMELNDELASMVRRFQGFENVANESWTERMRQAEDQNTAARAPAEVTNRLEQ